MRKFQDTAKRAKIYHGWRRAAYSWPAIFIMGLVVILLGRSTWRVYLRWDQARLQRNQVQDKYAELVKRQEELKIQVEKLKTKRGWEEEIRKNFQVAKPGEGVIIIVDEATSTR